jgi:hypothetical protein
MNVDDVDKYCESIIPSSGSIKKRSKRFGVGVNDLPHITKFIDQQGKTKMHSGYNQWATMLTRVYSAKYQERQKTYIGATVCEEWMYASNFIKWQKTQKRENGWQLDKDLLFVGNRVYSPDRCIYIPSWLNAFTTDSKANRGKYLIGVSYKERNKKYVARGSNPVTGERLNLGYFCSEINAYESWKRHKLSVAESLKTTMDAIDFRIYKNIVEIINNLE